MEQEKSKEGYTSFAVAGIDSPSYPCLLIQTNPLPARLREERLRERGKW
jgi:hypothetical protein